MIGSFSRGWLHAGAALLLATTTATTATAAERTVLGEYFTSVG